MTEAKKFSPHSTRPSSNPILVHEHLPFWALNIYFFHSTCRVNTASTFSGSQYRKRPNGGSEIGSGGLWREGYWPLTKLRQKGGSRICFSTHMCLMPSLMELTTHVRNNLSTHCFSFFLFFSFLFLFRFVLFLFLFLVPDRPRTCNMTLPGLQSPQSKCSLC